MSLLPFQQVATWPKRLGERQFHTLRVLKMYTDPEPPLCASLEKGRNGEFFVLRVTTHLNSSRHRPRSSWGKERKHLMHVNNSKIERGAGRAYRRDTCPPSLTNLGALEKCSNLDRLPWDLAGRLIILFRSELTAYLCHWALHMVRIRSFVIVG